MDFQSLAKTLNFKLPIKLEKHNYFNWKAQVLVTVRALELEDFIDESKSVLNRFIEDLDKDGVVKGTRITLEFRTWKCADHLLFYWLLSTISEGVLG